MASNWQDQQFDFDDLQPKKAAKKPKQQKKPKKNDDDFFDLDDEPPQKSSKLPIIAPKSKENIAPVISKEKSTKNAKKAYDDDQEIYEQVEEAKSPKKNEKSKPVENSNYYEELEQQEPIKPVQVKKGSVKEIPKPSKKQVEDEEFYESLQEKKPLTQPGKSVPQAQKNQKKNVKEQVQEEYEEQVFDEYGQDFQEIEEKPKEAELPKKSQTTVNLKSKDKNPKEVQKVKTEEKKLVINTNKVFTNKEDKQKDSKAAAPVIPKPPQKENTNKAQSKQHVEYSAPTNPTSKQKTLQKSSSKRSLQSNDSRKYLENSKVSTKKRTIEISTNRHVDLVQKQFPESEERINEYNTDKLTRLNEQVRQMIRKFNEQLNQLINKNMILLKDKPAQKKPNIDEKVKILQEQLKSGATAIEVVQNQLERLKGREGELREQQYQLIMEKKIEDMKETIKQTTKQITKLKFGVNNEGNKLSRQDIEKKIAQQLHQIKLMLVQTKKQEEKNDSKLEKLEKMVEQLESKNSDKQYQLSEQIDNAKDKGVKLNVNAFTKKRYDDLKLKIIAVQNHKKCMESLNKTKCDHLSHQNDQIRITIKSVESQISNFHQSIQHSQEQSLKLIKKAKENPKISTIMSQNLDKIAKSIEENQALNYYEVRTQGNKSQASDRDKPLKNSMYENMSKQKPPIRNTSNKKQPLSATKAKPIESSPSNDEINLMKPNFMKKKNFSSPHNEEQKNKIYERVWSEEQQRKEKQEKKKKKEQMERQAKRVEQQKKKEAQQLLAQEQQKQKPFNLKKNRMVSDNKEKSIEQSPEIKAIDKKSELQLNIPQIKPKEEEEKPSIGPKFMRLNKKEKNLQVNKTDQSIEKPIQSVKTIAQQPPKIQYKPEIKQENRPVEEDQPAFVPKRFNLRNKIEKKEDSYVPTIQKTNEVKETKELKPQVKEVKKEYAPNFSFKDQEPFKAAPIVSPPSVAPIIQVKKEDNEIKIDEEKPRFNLRLRDRQKKENNDDYVPTRLTQVVPERIPPKVENNSDNSYNPFDREIIKKDEPKPYQPSIKLTAPQKQADRPAKFEINPTKDSNPANKQAVINNAYAPKQPINNPYAQVQKDQNTNNPYFPKQQAPKREREGPLKKNKLLNKGPKEKINIYEQVEDITEPQVQIPVSQPPKQVNLAKTDELDLNAMLGIKKKEKASDLDDLLGEIKVDKKKQKKKNNDFFNDLEL